MSAETDLEPLEIALSKNNIEQIQIEYKKWYDKWWKYENDFNYFDTLMNIVAKNVKETKTLECICSLISPIYIIRYVYVALSKKRNLAKQMLECIDWKNSDNAIALMEYPELFEFMGLELDLCRSLIDYIVDKFSEDHSVKIIQTLLKTKSAANIIQYVSEMFDRKPNMVQKMLHDINWDDINQLIALMEYPALFELTYSRLDRPIVINKSIIARIFGCFSEDHSTTIIRTILKSPQTIIQAWPSFVNTLPFLDLLLPRVALQSCIIVSMVFRKQYIYIKHDIQTIYDALVEHHSVEYFTHIAQIEEKLYDGYLSKNIFAQILTKPGYENIAKHYMREEDKTDICLLDINSYYIYLITNGRITISLATKIPAHLTRYKFYLLDDEWRKLIAKRATETIFTFIFAHHMLAPDSRHIILNSYLYHDGYINADMTPNNKIYYIKYGEVACDICFMSADETKSGIMGTACNHTICQKCLELYNYDKCWMCRQRLDKKKIYPTIIYN